MNVILIIFLLIIFLVNISNNAPLSGENIINFELNNNITQIKQKIDFFYGDKNITIPEIILSTYLNDSFLNHSLHSFINESEFDTEIINYFYIRYQEEINVQDIYSILFNENITFKYVNISYNLLEQNNYSIFSLNNIDENKLILYDFINKKLIIDNYNDFFDNNNITQEEKDVVKEENLCHNKSFNIEGNKKFVCRLDYILFGHEDLPKDDVYLAKQIDDQFSIAYLDNLISYSIFPFEYLDYFFTSFFSELNDGCTKNSYETNLNEKFYYITCPKKKIDIYTKRRKLSIIMNKLSYKINNLFVDSFDFLNKNDINVDDYYFNILFEKDRKSFILGFGFLSNLIFSNYNHSTYIYSRDRIDYTDDLTDDSSDNFEKWLYILTTLSFTFVLLIFTIIGCFHSRKIKSELKEMLKSN